MKRFKAPKKTIGPLEAETAGALIAAVSDMALVIDKAGVVRDQAFGSEDLAQEFAGGDWVGRSLSDLVTIESRPKVQALLRDAAAGGADAMRWRHINHPSSRGSDLPVLYSAIALGDSGRVVAVGRDLRSIASLQQRLVAAQQSMEQDYARLRQAESRYRLLFQTATDGVLVLDAATFKVVEANPLAQQIVGDEGRGLVGRTFPQGFDSAGTKSLQSMLAGVRSAGSAEPVEVRLASGRLLGVSAVLLRQEGSSLLLVRIAPGGSNGGAASALSVAESQLARAVESAPDAFVVTSLDGEVLVANRAFLDLAQVATQDQVRGLSLERWLGRPGVDLSVLLANLRQHGAVRLFATTLRGQYGASTEVEISAVMINGGEPQCVGFAIRDIGRRIKNADAASGAARLLPRSVEQLTELIGQVSLKDLVREATDLIERMCIEAALELTGDNRASAAEVLGLSRQSLYVKLRRYGLGDLASESEN